MPRIFISYRRADDRPFTERVHEHLIKSLGSNRVFKDVEKLRPGVTFKDALEAELAICDVLLVMIGHQWANITDEKSGSKRLHDPADFVRMEVERGLAREDTIVVPVLLGDTSVPNADDLPESLRPLLERQVMRVRYDPDFRDDMDDFVKWLRSLDKRQRQRSFIFRGVAASFVLLSMLIVLVLLILRNEKFDGTRTVDNPPTATPLFTTSPQSITRVRTVTNNVPVWQTRGGGGLITYLDSNVNLLVEPSDQVGLEERLGVVGEWVLVILPTSLGLNEAIGWIAADRLEAYRTVPVGITLSFNNPQGLPQPSLLGDIQWIRLTYNVSYDRETGSFGNSDIERTFQLYTPVIQNYVDEGHKIILVFGHQVFGEGAGFVWPNMSDQDWERVTAGLRDLTQAIAAQYAGSGLVSAYQIWNEQDSRPENMIAAVPVPPEIYAEMLTQIIVGIRSVDPDALIITGGHVTGGTDGVQYLRTTLSLMTENIRPDGIAIHPYGVGPLGSRWSVFGTLNEQIDAYIQAAPNIPFWITEWGVLDVQGRDDFALSITEYAKGYMDILDAYYVDKVEVAIWYAWADNMDNAYGLVRSDGTPREPLFSWFTQRLQPEASLDE